MLEMSAQSASLALPEPGNALASAADWLMGLATGRLASAFAILAIASIGFALLQGHLSPRRAMRVVLGCFVLFGAPVIVNGLLLLVRGSASVFQPQEYAAHAPVPIPTTLAPLPIAVPSTQPATSNPFDPYAGISPPQ